MGRDRHLDLVGQLQPVTALEVLLGQEDLDVAHELAAIGIRQGGVERGVPLDDPEPLRREWGRSNSVPAPPAEESKHRRLLAMVLARAHPSPVDSTLGGTAALVHHAGGLASKIRLKSRGATIRCVEGGQEVPEIRRLGRRWVMATIVSEW